MTRLELFATGIMYLGRNEVNHDAKQIRVNRAKRFKCGGDWKRAGGSTGDMINEYPDYELIGIVKDEAFF